ncbi:MAG: leucine-rich repeat domain-containing protein, partial [Alistipes sp.]|nr:leucine-rich repeat domain-containing protein [Alistipes sp.]
MRKLYILIAAALVMGSCQNDTTEGFKGFESDKSEIKAKAAGGEHSITIRSDREWTAQADVPWLMISPANGRGEVECRVKVDSTLVNDPRTTTVRFMSDGEILQQIAITQDGFAHSIAASTDFVSIEASAVRAERYVEVDVKANVEFDVVSDVEWLSVGDYTLTLDRGARPRSTRLHIDWKMNSDPKSREAMLMLVPKNGETLEKPATIKVRQLAGPLIEDNRNGDSLAVVTIYNKMECWSEGVIAPGKGMQEWECVRLWKLGDAGLPLPDAIGRVRDLDLSYFNTEDDIPVEVKHLKYLETLSLYGNVNTMIKEINLCPEVATLDYLKALRIAAMGLVSLPNNFAELGDTLELLDLNSNNLTTIPSFINAENFPHLTSLDLSTNRRTSLSDLRGIASNSGIYVDMRNDDAIHRLFTWENLEELGLSFNYIEGELPKFENGEYGVRAYTDEDIAERGDTLRWAVENRLPRVLPNVRALRINLNFMTGDIPDWLLYHPNLMEWAAEVLIYPQQDKSYNSAGEVVGFSNTPTSREYYFEAYPLYRS